MMDKQKFKKIDDKVNFYTNTVVKDVNIQISF